MSHSNDLDHLVQGIYRPSIFYLPTSLFPDITTEQERELLEYRVVNDICILKENGDTSYADKCVPVIEMLNKSAILENNFYQLLKFNDSLSRETFSYLLNEYNKNTQACKQVYHWLLEHINNSIGPIAKEELELFKLQLSLITGHIEKVLNRFGKEMIDRKLNNGAAEFVINTSIFNKGQDNEILKLNSLRNTKTKKASMPSNSEVDKFLLETVFNVDLMK